MLIERLGFQSTFLVTAAIKALSFAPLLLLLGLLDEQLPCCNLCWRRKPAAVDGAVNGEAPDLTGREDPLRAPLLAGAEDAAQGDIAAEARAVSSRPTS